MSEAAAVILVGVAPGHVRPLVDTVVELAVDLDAEVVFAHVDPKEYVVRDRSGASHLTPVDPDAAGDEPGAQAAALEQEVSQLLAGRLPRWRVEHLAGDPSRELARVADDLRARLIVVGTRSPGRRHRVSEFFTGSIAVQLAHHQTRPVLVVPTTVTTFGAGAPWE